MTMIPNNEICPFTGLPVLLIFYLALSGHLLHGLQTGIDQIPNGRPSRHALCFQQYNTYLIRYKGIKKNFTPRKINPAYVTRWRNGDS